MKNKLIGIGICLSLASSLCLAEADNNPFSDKTVTLATKTEVANATETVAVIAKEDTNKTTVNATKAVKTVDYAVEPGDYLMKIARKFYGDSEKWQLLVEANKDKYPSLISNPNLIYVDWNLTIPDAIYPDGDGESKSTVVVTNEQATSSNSSTNSSSISSNTNPIGHTQASEFAALGDKAYNEWQEYTENSARGEWIRKVGTIVKNTNTFGMKKSLIIAQIINESGWMHSGNSLSKYNNVLGINTDMGRIKPSMQTSTWSKKQTSGNNNVTQWSSDGSHIVGTVEAMRHYDSIEECIEDYAEVMSLYHPECKGNNNIEAYRSFLEGYTPNPNASTTDKYINIIKKFNLEQYDE